jgi:carbamate kinase
VRIVVALGDQALVRTGEPATLAVQIATIGAGATAIAALCRAGHQVVITHGDGPQAGFLALQAAATTDRPYPLDVLEAGGEGVLGYIIEQALMNELPGDGMVATLLTQVRVDRDDPSFVHPVTPVGPLYSESEARALAAERGWRVGRDGEGWRRVVASPRARQILEVRVIEMLVNRGVTVICVGGGIPVIEQENGSLTGVDAVIDKDSASSLLARQLRADWLVMLTDVDGVYDEFGTPAASRLTRVSPTQLLQRRFPAHSMGRKVDAACDFVQTTGGRAGIGRVGALTKILTGEAGTLIGLMH